MDQQTETPINEPVLAAMRAPGARVLKSAAFYPVEAQGSGRALLYRLAGGRGVLRLRSFRTSTNSDLSVWLSVAARPRTTEQVVRAERVGRLRALKSTIGAQYHRLPPDLDLRRIRSIALGEPCVAMPVRRDARSQAGQGPGKGEVRVKLFAADPPESARGAAAGAGLGGSAAVRARARNVEARR